MRRPLPTLLHLHARIASRRLRNLGITRQACGKYANNILILGSIFAIGTWGHLNHWEFHHAHADNHVAHATSAESDHSETHHELHVAKSKVPQTVEHSPRRLMNPVTEPSNVIEAHATLEHDPNFVAELSSRISGIVNRVFKRVGDHVEKGDVLVLVEAPAVGEAKADLLKALVQHDLKSRTLRQLLELGSVVSEKKIQEAEAASREAEIDLFNAQQALITLGLPVNLDEFSGKQDEELAAQVLALGLPESLQEEARSGSLTANLIPILAPFSGEIIQSSLVVGEFAQASLPLITIADRKHFWISLNLRREDAPRVYLGQEVTFQADCSENHLAARIDWISTEVDETTRTLEARAIYIAESSQAAQHLRSNILGTCRLDTNPAAKIAGSEATRSPR